MNSTSASSLVLHFFWFRERSPKAELKWIFLVEIFSRNTLNLFIFSAKIWLYKIVVTRQNWEKLQLHLKKYFYVTMLNKITIYWNFWTKSWYIDCIKIQQIFFGQRNLRLKKEREEEDRKCFSTFLLPNYIFSPQQFPTLRFPTKKDFFSSAIFYGKLEKFWSTCFRCRVDK